MTLREFFDRTGGDYAGAMDRFVEENRVRRFVRMFPDDPCFGELESALQEGRTESAFQAAHTLKGVCLNIGFSGLCASVSAVTEALRAGDRDEACACMPEVRHRYHQIMDALRELA